MTDTKWCLYVLVGIVGSVAYGDSKEREGGCLQVLRGGEGTRWYKSLSGGNGGVLRVEFIETYPSALLHKVGAIKNKILIELETTQVS